MRISTALTSFVFLISAADAFHEPKWFDRIKTEMEADNDLTMKRCHRRDVAPTEGSSCANLPKTCFFGSQECAGGMFHPEAKCTCSGMADPTWTCKPTPCPTNTTAAANDVAGGTMQNGSSTSLAKASTTDAEEILRSVDKEIRQILAKDPSIAATFIRLSFHDCVPNAPDGGGCDGCVNLSSNPANKGLAKAVDSLAPIVAQHNTSAEVSRADIWMYAAMVAAEVSQTDVLFTDNFKIGRFTCEMRGTCSSNDPVFCASNGPDEEDQFPNTDMHTHEIMNFFVDHFGFDVDQTIALLGVHTVGKAMRSNSGYDGPFGWVQNNTHLDNDFYKQLVGDANSIEDGADLVFVEVDNSDIPNIGNEHQWIQNITTLDGITTKTHLMLNSDVALVRDMGQLEDGEECTFKTEARGKRCPIADTIGVVAKYSQDNILWLNDFKSVLTLMIEKAP